MLCLAIFICSVVSAGAVPAVFAQMGDADQDYHITITDVTFIQRYLANSMTFSRVQEVASDVNGNGQVDIVDATIIQRDVAGYESEYSDVLVNYVYYYVNDTKIEATRISDTEYEFSFTFSAYTDKRFLPLSYEVIIDDVLVRERSEDASFTWTFDSPGLHYVDVVSYNAADAFHRGTEYVIIHVPDNAVVDESENSIEAETEDIIVN